MAKTFNSWFFSAPVLLVAVVLLAVGPAISQAQFIVYTESFEYADQAALVAEWPRGDEDNGNAPFGDCDPGCYWPDEIGLDAGNASDGTKSASFNGGTLDRADPVFGDTGDAGLKANLGIGGAPVSKVSWDTLADSAQGYDGSVVFQMETITGTADNQSPDEFLGSVFTNSGSLQLQFASQNANVITPLGISLLDGEWNTIDVTIAENGIDRNFSVTNSGGTFNSAYTATDVVGNAIDRILMYDNLTDVTEAPAPPNNGGRIDNIIIETSSPPPTEFTWNNAASDTWNSPANWTLDSIGNAFPGSIEHKAIFGDAIGSDTRVVFSDQAITLNGIEFNNTMGGSYQIVGGPAGITLSDSAALTAPTVDVLDGSHELQIPVTLTGDTTITSGDDTTLTFHNIIDLGANDLTINRAGGGLQNGIVNLSTQVRGTGSVTNNATLVLALGAALGGDLVSSGTLDFDITPDASGQLTVGGTATLDGAVNVDFLDGATPEGDIALLTASNGILLPSGLPSLSVTGADGLALALSVDGRSLLLTAIPEPTTVSLLMLVGLVGLARRRSHRGLVCGLAMVVLLGVVPTAANAQFVVYTESFEYADQAALAAEWPRGDEDNGNAPFGDCDPGCFWPAEIGLDAGNASDGTKSASFNGGTLDFSDPMFGDTGTAGLNANLGIGGAPVSKVSVDFLRDTANGIDGWVIFQMELKAITSSKL